MPAETVHVDARFSADFLRFFVELKRHNNKEWFTANKQRFELVVKEPCLAFVRAVGPGLQRISKTVTADPRPVGGSMFRIYRDTRFSKDKSPYKTNAAMHFKHRDTTEETHLPGFYLHLAPGDSGAYAGAWQPDPPRLQAIREAIVEKPDAWKKAKATGTIERMDALKRVPKGFDPEHPLAEDLKMKDFILVRTFKDSEVTAKDFPERFVAACREMAPFNAFLAKSMGVAW